MSSTEATGVGHCGSKARCASSLNTLCQALYIRLHIELDDELVAQIDQLSGPRSRSAFRAFGHRACTSPRDPLVRPPSRSWRHCGSRSRLGCRSGRLGVEAAPS
jgi:hypothetical protein